MKSKGENILKRNGQQCHLLKDNETWWKVLYMAIEKPMSKSANLISGVEARWQLYYNCFLDPSS